MSAPSQKNSLISQKQKSLNSLSKLIFNTLLKPNRWYTGNSIKTWIRSNLFLSDLGVQLNQNLQTNRWSAYCHFNQNVCFANLVDKCNPSPKGNVLVHPLLEPNLVEILIQKGLSVQAIDIHKENLNFQAQDLVNFINSNPIEFVVIPIFNGLAKDIHSILQVCYQNHIPVILIITEQELTSDLYRLITLPGATAVIYKTGPSWFPPIINQITRAEMVIGDEDWYFSWFLEDRIVSSTETHLGQSQAAFANFLEQTHFLLTQKIKSFKWTEYVMEQFSLKALYKNKFSSAKSSINQIENEVWANWQNIQKYALPDIVFEVPQAQTVVDQNKFVHAQVFKWSQWQLNAKKMYNFCVNQVSTQPEGSMEVPVFYLDQTYLYYHFFSTNLAYWQQTLSEKKFKFKIGFPVHSIFENQAEKLPNTDLARQFCIQIKAPDRDMWL
jgi:hypothetical protein